MGHYLKLQFKRKRQGETDYAHMGNGSASSSKRMKHSTPNDNPDDFDCLLLGNDVKQMDFDCVANSTPLNRFSSSRVDCRKIRKELTRSQLK